MMLLNEAVDEVIRRLSEVPGTATQDYSEERIVRLLNSAFKFIRSHCDWPELLTWHQRTLNGVDGRVTVPIANVLGPKDIKFIYPVNSDVKLALLPTTINPANVVLSTTQPRWVQLLGPADDPITQQGKFLFRLWPQAATGDINILVKNNRIYTSKMMDDELWLDDEAMILHACMRQANSDGANQAEQGDFASQFADRMRQITKENLNLPIDNNPGSTTTPYSWFDPTVYYA